jgi:COP9 signalosome complex subunit 7
VGGLPELTANQKKKLQHLTIITLSEQGKCIPYKTLLEELGVTNVRELEDLIIEAIYSGKRIFINSPFYVS